MIPSPSIHLHPKIFSFHFLFFFKGSKKKPIKIQRQDSGGDLPPGGPVTRRVNSFQSVTMDDVMESGNLGPYQERLRTFPNMRTKPYTPLVRILFRASYFAFYCTIYGLPYILWIIVCINIIGLIIHITNRLINHIKLI